MKGCGKILNGGVLAILLACAISMMGCTADGDPVSIDPIIVSSSTSKGVKSSASVSSSSQGESSSSEDNTLDGYQKMVIVPESKLIRGSVTYEVKAFKIGTTEVTQKLYFDVVGSLPDQPMVGDSLPIVGVNWYEAVLFCNELSKKVGLDTAYVYASLGDESYLENLTIDYSVAAVRLPTETEWEIAARAGTTTTYYWDVAEASKYANYGQINKSLTKVASFIPNAFGLYDMGGNAAEWVNDWFGSYPTASVENFAGASKGTTRCVRGGSWADKVTALASSERSSKDPLYSSAMLGFRIVYSSGF